MRVDRKLRRFSSSYGYKESAPWTEQGTTLKKYTTLPTLTYQDKVAEWCNTVVGLYILKYSDDRMMISRALARIEHAA